LHVFQTPVATIFILNKSEESIKAYDKVIEINPRPEML